jgi:NAD-dependent dihydropyrimidine dehydrogenase PreA subunit/DNA-binding Lrp family transcriptional regulator
MSEDVYKRLARHLDRLPAGYPETESGVELRILRRLFTPEEADLALHTTLIPEEARVIARRAGLSVEEAARRLEEMAGKGLVYTIDPPGKPTLYMAAQFAIGIWEYQVNRLDEGLIRDMNEYLPTFVDLAAWEKAPQLRTVPVDRSLDAGLKVLSYESAKELIRGRSKIRVVPCICRTEHAMVGEGCDKPRESCLVFGTGAHYYERRGIGRDISPEECAEILEKADGAGLVLQPNNARRITNICCCCGCCCQVLIHMKKHPRPAEIVSTPFTLSHDPETCTACGVCVQRCQMDAVSMEDDRVTVRRERCIGCGLCVSTCPTRSLSLVRKPEPEQTPVPENVLESYKRMGRARGKMGPLSMARMSIRSKWDRLLAGKPEPRGKGA